MRQVQLDDLEARLNKARDRGVGIHLPGSVLTFAGADLLQVVLEAQMLRAIKPSLSATQLAVALRLKP